jgi:hypothetical protein
VTRLQCCRNAVGYPLRLVEREKQSATGDLDEAGVG